MPVVEGRTPSRMTTSAYAWDVPAAFNFGRDVIDVLGREDRRGLLFVDADGARSDVSFPQIAEYSQRYAGALRELGIGPGERVVVVLPKIPAWLYAMIALARLGAVVVPSSEQLRAKDLAFRAIHSEATTIVAHASNRAEVDALRALAPNVTRYILVGGRADGWIALDERVTRSRAFPGYPTRSDDMAYIVYTSGTTKDPKGVVHVHAYTYAKRMQARVWLDARPTICCGVRPVRAGRNRFGTCCLGRGRAAPRSCSMPAASNRPNAWISSAISR